MDRTIQPLNNWGQINYYPVDKYMIRETNCAIHWIVFYPLDSAIQPLNNGARCIKLWYSELDDAIWQTKSTRPAQAWNILLMSSATAPSVVFITFLFFVSLVLIDLYMSIQSCAIDCVLYFFPSNVAHNWNPVPYIFWALKTSRSLPSFGIRGRTWFGESCYVNVYRQTFLVFYQLKQLHNITTEWSIIPYRQHLVNDWTCHKSTSRVSKRAERSF